MKHTFSKYLFSAFIVVIGVSVGTIALVVSAGSEQEFEIYERRSARLELMRMEHWLGAYYLTTPGWDGIVPYVEEMGILSGRHVVLTDVEDTVIADSRDNELERAGFRDWPSRDIHVHDGSELVGTVYVSAEPNVGTTFLEQLAESINLLLLWGGILALLFALPLSFVLGRPIARAIREMATSARLAGAGDFSVRIKRRHRGELGELADALNSMVEDLSRTRQLRRNLVADTAHELRTPITNIRGFVEAAEDGLVTPGNALHAISEETELLSRLADDLQELAIADAGALNLDRAPSPVRELIRRAARPADRQASSNEVSVDFDLEANLPSIVVDEKRIGQVLGNILRNAFAYAPSGSTVTISAYRSAGLSAPPHGSGATEKRSSAPAAVEIAVADRGPGIAAEHRELVFERFYRVDGSRARSTGGSGLGLAIARKIVEAHGGDIRCEARDGGGTRIIVRLPIVPPPAAADA